MNESSKTPKEGPSGPKLPYHAPQLHAHGGLREITRSSASSGTINYSDSPQPYTS